MKKSTLKKRGVSKKKEASVKPFSLSSKVYFLTYSGKCCCTKKKATCRTITKPQILHFLLHQNPNDRKLRPKKYLICQQTYQDGITPHFHVILVYDRRKQITTPEFFDYMNIHPNIQPMRNMKAALEYVHKEDKNPLTNMDVLQQMRVARAKDTSSLYQLLQQQMLKNPFHFDLDDYCRTYGLFKQIYKADYNKAINLIKRAQYAEIRGRLRDLPGIKLITTKLIQQRLTADELRQFYSHSCYQKIVDHINQIHKYPNKNLATKAPSKTPHLLIVGDSSIGKSALVDHIANQIYPYPGLMHYYSTYHLSIGQKFFPPYRSFDYRIVRWNQFTIDSDIFPKKSYHRLLDYLEGAPSALPQKGRAPVQRQDNPKHILTSNRTLEQHICKTFQSQQSRFIARRNLGTRVDCVVVPRGKNIHFLRKLFVSEDS